mmetsp:Transcript_30643/g.65202  ORF Transcript_30643/g.65202 Transcript_30643/m.65202 type:complete len:218 (-) Transcript_30643:711-1364(-)
MPTPAGIGISSPGSTATKVLESGSGAAAPLLAATWLSASTGGSAEFSVCSFNSSVNAGSTGCVEDTCPGTACSSGWSSSVGNAFCSAASSGCVEAACSGTACSSGCSSSAGNAFCSAACAAPDAGAPAGAADAAGAVEGGDDVLPEALLMATATPPSSSKFSKWSPLASKLMKALSAFFKSIPLSAANLSISSSSTCPSAFLSRVLRNNSAVFGSLA